MLRDAEKEHPKHRREENLQPQRVEKCTQIHSGEPFQQLPKCSGLSALWVKTSFVVSFLKTPRHLEVKREEQREWQDRNLLLCYETVIGSKAASSVSTTGASKQFRHHLRKAFKSIFSST